MFFLKLEMNENKKAPKVMVPPINQLFKLLQTNSTVSVWLVEKKNERITGVLKGFDEFMNIVLENAVQIVEDEKRDIGTIMLKGDTISLISQIPK